MQTHKDRVRESQRTHAARARAARPEHFRETDRRYSKRNRAKILARQRERRKRPEVFAKERVSKVAWNKKNRDKINQRRKERNAKDIKFCMMNRLRARLSKAFEHAGVKRASSTKILIGCSIEFFRDYLQSRFKPGMTWGNRKEWHVDHIIPCAAFDLTNPDEQRKCFHYSNLQPLWAKENQMKHAKVPSSEPIDENYFNRPKP